MTVGTTHTQTKIGDIGIEEDEMTTAEEETITTDTTMIDEGTMTAATQEITQGIAEESQQEECH